jgi:ferredoxin
VHDRLNPDLLLDMRKHGELSIEKCFNCGNCTAICPLSANGETFPRRLIRYAQLGLEAPLLGSRELWLCYACGECTETCPRQADPGEFMAVARRYAVARYDPLGLARVLFTRPLLGVPLLVLLGVLIALVFYTSHGVMRGDALRLFEFLPAAAIHDLGVGVMALVGLAGLAGVVNMLRCLRRQSVGTASPPAGRRWARALWDTLGSEVLAQRRYRMDCRTEADRRPWFRQRWLVHGLMLWGFLGLLAATGLDYGLALAGVKPIGAWVPLWYPVRLLGTVAGLSMAGGTSIAILDRLRKADVATSRSSPADWTLLVFLWLAGTSGLVLEGAIYLARPAPWAYWLLLGHVAVSVELLLLLPFTKLAHALYRTVAVYLHALAAAPGAPRSEAGVA